MVDKGFASDGGADAGFAGIDPDTPPNRLRARRAACYTGSMDPNGRFAAQLIRAGQRAHAAAVVDWMRTRRPELIDRDVPRAFADPHDDVATRLLFTAEAVAADCPVLLSRQAAWDKVAQAARDVPAEYLAMTLEGIAVRLARTLPAEVAQRAAEAARAAAASLAAAPAQLPSLLAPDTQITALARPFLLAALETRADDAVAILRDAVADGLPVARAHEVLTLVQSEIGRMWQMAEVHTAEEHYASHVVERAMAAIRNAAPCQPGCGRRVLTVAATGNLHELGIRMIKDAFELDGWTAVHVGTGIPGLDVAAAVQHFEADLLAVSTTMTLHLSATADLIAAVRSATDTKALPILVGGPPYLAVADLWRRVGADAMATDPADAVAAGTTLVQR